MPINVYDIANDDGTSAIFQTSKQSNENGSFFCKKLKEHSKQRKDSKHFNHVE